MTNTSDTYILAEYIVTDPETKRPVHRRVNLQYKRNPFNGAVMGARVYGTWRNRGFWTEKDYKPEEGLEEVFLKAQNTFMSPEVVRSDEKFAEAKAQLDKDVRAVMDKIKGAESLKLGVYGADHSHMDLGRTPMAPPTADTSVVKVNDIW